MRSRWIETATQSGPTVEQAEFTATLQSWSLTAAWPGGGWVWNRPRAVIVEREGSQERIPIYHVTLLVQIALFVLALAVAYSFVAPFATRSTHRRKSDD